MDELTEVPSVCLSFRRPLEVTKASGWMMIVMSLSTTSLKRIRFYWSGTLAPWYFADSLPTVFLLFFSLLFLLLIFPMNDRLIDWLNHDSSHKDGNKEDSSKSSLNQFITVLDPHFQIKKKKKIDFDTTVYDVRSLLLLSFPTQCLTVCISIYLAHGTKKWRPRSIWAVPYLKRWRRWLVVRRSPEHYPLWSHQVRQRRTKKNQRGSMKNSYSIHWIAVSISRRWLSHNFHRIQTKSKMKSMEDSRTRSTFTSTYPQQSFNRASLLTVQR